MRAHSPFQLIIRPNNRSPQSLFICKNSIGYLSTTWYGNTPHGKPRLIVRSEFPDKDPVFLSTSGSNVVILGCLLLTIDLSIGLLFWFWWWGAESFRV